jgi:hypothetical protein
MFHPLLGMTNARLICQNPRPNNIIKYDCTPRIDKCGARQWWFPITGRSTLATQLCRYCSSISNCYLTAIYLELAKVPDRHFASRSRSQPNSCQIGGPGYLHTRTVNSGTVRCKSANPFGLGGLSAGRQACPSVDLYNVLVFAVQ